MGRVPNRRGYIVMAVGLSLGLINIVVLLMYLWVMKDVLFERLCFWSFRPKICAYLIADLVMCVCFRQKVIVSLTSKSISLR